MAGSKKTRAKVKKSDDGISRNERKRRSKLSPENPNVILPNNPLYLATKRKQMKRYGSEIPRQYRIYDVDQKDWIDWNPAIHKNKDRVEECDLFSFIRSNKDQPDLDVEVGYDTGSSMNNTLHIIVNHPGSTGSAGTTNNSEMCKFLNFTETYFPDSRETILIKGWRAKKLIPEPPYNGQIFPFQWHKTIICTYLKCLVTQKLKPNGQPHEGFVINGLTILPRECGYTVVRTFCGALNNVQSKLITDLQHGPVKKVIIYMYT
jgi:hypothetical protein